MQRVLILGSVLLALVGMGVTRFAGLESRLEALDRMREEMPSRARAIEADLARIESELAEARQALADARSQDEIAMAIAEERIARLGSELASSREELAKASREQAEWAICMESHATRLSELEAGAESRLDGLTQTVNATARLAERTSNELGELNAGLRGASEETRWRELVGPTVQLAGESTVGSGVLLASRREKDDPEQWETLVLTAWHVVRDIRADSLEAEIPIPVAVYLEGGEVLHETSELLVHDADLDVALLRLSTTDNLPFGARLPSRAVLDAVHVFRSIYAVGCPLGNDPIPTRGELSALHHRVDGKDYWMISAPTYIGNSGGGIFDGDSLVLLGIFSKIYTHGSLRPTVVPHMGLATPLPKIYDWLESNGFAELLSTEDGLELALAEPLRRAAAGATPTGINAGSVVPR